jgi:hypothetical protein
LSIGPLCADFQFRALVTSVHPIASGDSTPQRLPSTIDSGKIDGDNFSFSVTLK